MYPLAHVTLASGVVWAGARLLDRAGAGRGVPEVVVADTVPGPRPAEDGAVAGTGLADATDYRLVALGALLPDLIDKPVGWVLLRGPLDGNGHLVGHTLLFALVLLLAGRGDPRLLSMGVAVLTHLASDPVAHSPGNLLWPLLGWELPKARLLDRGETILTETGAGLILLLVAMSLRRRGRLDRLVREGRL